MPIATFSRRSLFADGTFGVVALVDTNIHFSHRNITPSQPPAGGA
jgi:hypothetical protein